MQKIFLVNQTGVPQNDPIQSFLKTHFTVMDSPEGAEMVLVLGGDGTMLKAIRTYHHNRITFSGLNYGHIGFLMNSARVDILEEILRNDVTIISMNLLQAILFNAKGVRIGEEYAFNDCYFERTTPQTAKIRISVDDKVRFDPLIGDGVIVSTCAGSTAYNASAGGAILPMETNSMVLTGICPAVFHYWRTSQLPAESTVTMEPVETDKRPVRFITDGQILEGVAKAKIRYSDRLVKLAFAGSQDFREKVMNLQFYKGIFH